MGGYVLKAADRRITFTIDWRRGYLSPGEMVSADLGWKIQPVRNPAEDLVVTEQRHDLSRSSADFAAGVPGQVYLVTSRVRTSRDRVLERAIVMRIALGRGPH